MKVRMQKDFEVTHPPQAVWGYFLDPMEVSECVPGVTLDQKIDDRNYKGKVSLQFGPISANFDAKAIYESVDEAGKKIVLLGKGSDAGGAGNVDMRMELTLSEKGGGSHVQSNMEISIHGRMAQFGSRMIQDVSDELFAQFVKNFTNKLNQVELTDADKKVSMWKMIQLLAKRVFRR